MVKIKNYVNSFLLSPSEYEMLWTFFDKKTTISEVRIFGSRAKENARKNSDIDFVTMDSIDMYEEGHIWEELNELCLAYQIDFKVYSQITYLPLKKHIDTFSKPFYMREL